jgi:predicted nucleic acid-binding protein
MKNVVDSSGWLEYFAEGENSDFFAPAIEDVDNLLIPVICVYEIFKRILVLRGLDIAERRIADLFKGEVLELSVPVALSSARISVEFKLSMADSILLATSRDRQAVLWTQDVHFKYLPEVKFIDKRRN